MKSGPYKVSNAKLKMRDEKEVFNFFIKKADLDLFFIEIILALEVNLKCFFTYAPSLTPSNLVHTLVLSL